MRSVEPFSDIAATARLLFRLYGIVGLSNLEKVGKYRSDTGSGSVMSERLKEPCDLMKLSQLFNNEMVCILWGSKADLIRNCSTGELNNAVNVITSVLHQ